MGAERVVDELKCEGDSARKVLRDGAARGAVSGVLTQLKEERI